MNLNNCETCDYKKMNEGQDGWCYMFKDEPTELCMAHSGRKPDFAAIKNLQETLDDLMISLMPGR